ncbi:MAG: DUF6491 family protein [Asticcacaulis sp.]
MQKSLYLTVLTAAVAGLALVTGVSSLAMSSKPVASTENPAVRDRYACFSSSRIRDYDAIDDRRLVIVSDQNQAYELGLGAGCMGIDYSMRIGVKSRGYGYGDICGPFDGSILYGDMGQSLQSCPIVSVKHLTGEAAEPYVTKRKTKTAEKGQKQ